MTNAWIDKVEKVLLSRYSSRLSTLLNATATLLPPPRPQVPPCVDHHHLPSNQRPRSQEEQNRFNHFDRSGGGAERRGRFDLLLVGVVPASGSGERTEGITGEGEPTCRFPSRSRAIDLG